MSEITSYHDVREKNGNQGKQDMINNKGDKQQKQQKLINPQKGNQAISHLANQSTDNSIDKQIQNTKQSKSSFLLSFEQYLQSQFVSIQNKLNQMNKRLKEEQSKNKKLEEKILVLENEKIVDREVVQGVCYKVNVLMERKSAYTEGGSVSNKVSVSQNDDPQIVLQQKDKLQAKVDPIQTTKNIKNQKTENQATENTQMNHQNKHILDLQKRLNDVQIKLKKMRILNQDKIKHSIQENEKLSIMENEEKKNGWQRSNQQNLLKLEQKDNKILQIHSLNLNSNSSNLGENPQQFKNLIMRQNDLLNKKLYQLQISFSDLEEKIKKNLMKFQQSTERYEDEVANLKNQVQDYKLKKQAKYLKMMAASGNGQNGQGSNNNSLKNSTSNSAGQQNHIKQSLQEYLQYLAQKVHYLTLVNKQLLPRQTYEDEIQYIHQILLSIRKRLAQKVSYEEMNKINTIEEIKFMKKPPVIYKADRVKNEDQEVGRKVRGNGESGKVIKGKQEVLRGNEGENKVLNQKMEQPKPNNQIQQLQQVKPSVQPGNKNAQNILSQISQLSIKVESHEEFMKQMNKFYNEKLNLLQLAIQKLEKENDSIAKFHNTKHGKQSQKQHSSHPKRRNLVQEASIKSLHDVNLKQKYLSQNEAAQSDLQRSKHSDLNTNQDLIKSKQYIIRNHLDVKQLQNSHSQQQPQIQKLNSNILHRSGADLHNFELNSVKKKINKLNAKYDSVQKNLIVFRQEIIKNLDILHKQEQDKADWQSFKKAIKYFDEKTKILQETINIVIKTLKEEGSLLNNGSSGNISNNGQSPQIAAKRKWSCLFCDKQMKNYEGKVSEVKYMGVFPNHRYESPRLGGYYKQSVKEKQYEKLYLNGNSTTGNRILHKSVARKTPKNSLQRSKQAIKNIGQQNIFQYNNLGQNQDLKLKGFQE